MKRYAQLGWLMIAVLLLSLGVGSVDAQPVSQAGREGLCATEISNFARDAEAVGAASDAMREPYQRYNQLLQLVAAMEAGARAGIKLEVKAGEAAIMAVLPQTRLITIQPICSGVIGKFTSKLCEMGLPNLSDTLYPQPGDSFFPLEDLAKDLYGFITSLDDAVEATELLVTGEVRQIHDDYAAALAAYRRAGDQFIASNNAMFSCTEREHIPDEDRDAVPDNVDDCIGEAGIIQSRGCRVAPADEGIDESLCLQVAASGIEGNCTSELVPVYECIEVFPGFYSWETWQNIYVDGTLIAEVFLSGPYLGSYQEGCPEPEEEADALDLVFVIDTTSSMEDDIDRVKSDAQRIIEQVETSNTDWRIAVTTFRDYPEAPYGDAGDYVARMEVDFSDDAGEISAAIHAITVAGGGDTPEAVCSALLLAIRMDWREEAQRIVILMGDAPPHDPEPNSGCTIGGMMEEAFAGDREHVYPIIIADNPDALRSFNAIADGTGGQVFSAAGSEDVVDSILEAVDFAAAARLIPGEPAIVHTVIDDTLNLRSGPGTDFDILERMPAGTLVTVGEAVVFSYPYVWHQITSASGAAGWAVEAADGQITLRHVSEREAEALPTLPCTLVVNDGPANVRSGPSTEYGRVRQILTGFSAVAVAYANSPAGFIWYQLEDGGWIRSDTVTSNGNCALIPVVGG